LKLLLMVQEFFMFVVLNAFGNYCANFAIPAGFQRLILKLAGNRADWSLF
jgi:hypothetical protein